MAALPEFVRDRRSLDGLAVLEVDNQSARAFETAHIDPDIAQYLALRLYGVGRADDGGNFLRAHAGPDLARIVPLEWRACAGGEKGCCRDCRDELHHDGVTSQNEGQFSLRL